MFLYLSFVRPPPTSTDGHIAISIQIANDLRTEICEDEYHVHYAWLSAGGAPIGPAKKLTTWRPGVENKMLDLVVPSIASSQRAGAARPAPTVTLMLWATHTSETLPTSLTADFIPLTDAGFGRTPFPLMSLPIHINKIASTNSKTKHVPRTQKQEKIERRILLTEWRQRTDDNVIPRFITLREDTSYDLDKKVWDSGLGLSSWFADVINGTHAYKILKPGTSNIRDLLLKGSALDAIELGCGTGLVSIVLAALLEPRRRGMQTSIMATDLASAIPLIEHNVIANKTLYPSIPVLQEVLDWEDEPGLLATRFPTGHNLIIMADVTYNTDMFPPLLRTLNALIRLNPPSTSSDPISEEQNDLPLTIILAYKERDPAERTLFALARDIGVDFEELSRIPGAGGNPIEIYIGTVAMTMPGNSQHI